MNDSYLTSLNAWDDGYSIGWQEGKHEGYTQGYNDAVRDYELRLKKYWAELQTLNARVDYLNDVLDGKQNER